MPVSIRVKRLQQVPSYNRDTKQYDKIVDQEIEIILEAPSIKDFPDLYVHAQEIFSLGDRAFANYLKNKRKGSSYNDQGAGDTPF